ncbi:uncharacterized protein LOC132552209 [Ylistrum balloti]|uniref:uncharacterized protein LOC132552209 n=1 Tax=Ylistrum balloti TaxID=509963 RepID=UPI002905F69B|nr:uncharacterized protein LOC132552209 [Ylistrum balloti]
MRVLSVGEMQLNEAFYFRLLVVRSGYFCIYVMTQRRHIVVDPSSIDQKDIADVASLDGTEGCPAPLLGRCLLGCYYFFRPSKRPIIYEVDPTLFVEPVWTGTHSTDVQSDDEVVIDTMVESRPLRLMSSVFSSTLAPSSRYPRAAVELPCQLPDESESPAELISRQMSGSYGPIYEHAKGSILAISEKSVRETMELPNVSAADGDIGNQKPVKKSPDVSAHRYEWFRSILGWTSSV